MTRTKLAAATAFALFTVHAALAQQAAPATRPADTGFTLTIYSSADPATFDPKELSRQRQMNPYNRYQLRLPGYGVVRQVRPLKLKAGVNEIKFIDVAEGIDPTTVAFESLTDPAGTSVLEQNYEYDVVSADKLLEKYLGKAIVVLQKREGREPERITGRLLSYDGGSLVMNTDEANAPVRVLPRNPDIVSISLSDAASLITEPTLVWRVDTNRAGKHDARVTYQTDGMTWRADYNVVVNANDTAADIGAWVSILNESGASFPDARLKLVAGDVQRIQPQQNPYAMTQGAYKEAAAFDRSGGFQESPSSNTTSTPSAARPRCRTTRRSRSSCSRRAPTCRSRRRSSTTACPKTCATGFRPSRTRTATSARRATKRSTFTFRSRTRRRTVWASRSPQGGCASTSRMRPTARTNSSART